MLPTWSVAVPTKTLGGATMSIRDDAQVMEPMTFILGLSGAFDVLAENLHCGEMVHLQIITTRCIQLTGHRTDGDDLPWDIGKPYTLMRGGKTGHVRYYKIKVTSKGLTVPTAQEFFCDGYDLNDVPPKYRQPDEDGVQRSVAISACGAPAPLRGNALPPTLTSIYRALGSGVRPRPGGG
eukprot:COSAG06_NODE_353_length_16899_cov_14.694345_8_plen_180_part_00